jgi:hypothetical protein
MRRILIGAFILGVVFAFRTTWAAQPRPTFLDPQKAGRDFAIQGEYTAKIGEQRALGAQVIAEGDGKFTVVFLYGGLPGAGWNAKTKIKVPASTQEGKTTFSGNGWSGTIADGNIAVKTPRGNTFTLNKVVRKSPTLGAQPPEGAVVLFDGTSADQWINGKVVEKNLLQMGTTCKKKLKDCKIHLEFCLPFQPFDRGQGRANSGVYVLNCYEIQVLDSFGLEGKNNECGGIYTQKDPSVNMCFPPLSWQTYDIEFKAARFDSSGKKIQPAVLTILHNGVNICDQFELRGPTPGNQQGEDRPGPIQLQNHGNPVYFRNIWVVEAK